MIFSSSLSGFVRLIEPMGTTTAVKLRWSYLISLEGHRFAAGEKIFNSFPIKITDVRGLNDKSNPRQAGCDHGNLRNVP
jgi:hypothetical protein